MSELKQIELFDRKLGHGNRQYVYIPPEADTIDKYCEFVCRRIGQGSDDEQLPNDMLRGFSTFMKMVVKIKAKHLNRGGAA